MMHLFVNTFQMAAVVLRLKCQGRSSQTITHKVHLLTTVQLQAEKWARSTSHPHSRSCSCRQSRPMASLTTSITQAPTPVTTITITPNTVVSTFITLTVTGTLMSLTVLGAHKLGVGCLPLLLLLRMLTVLIIHESCWSFLQPRSSSAIQSNRQWKRNVSATVGCRSIWNVALRAKKFRPQYAACL